MQNDHNNIGKKMQRMTSLFGWGVVLLSSLVLIIWWYNADWHYDVLIAPPSPPAQVCQSTISTMPIRNPDAKTDSASLWRAPDYVASLSEEIQYGRQLVTQTAQFYGPKGRLSPNKTNALSCQNCHLDAGTRPFGNNYSAVAATYPKFRARSGQIETLEFRINDCFRRSLNGSPPAPNSREMAAIKAYILWVGKDVPKDSTPKGAGIARLPFLNRAASPLRGSEVYAKYCASCHQKDGQGQLDSLQIHYKYPPLWGDFSYNTAAGMYRLSHLAGFAKYNMPHGQATFRQPILTDDEAWDVAAYINSQPRPHKNFPQDFPNWSQKPPDHPFPPYADTFSQLQHKFGPFAPIKAAQQATCNK